MPVRRSVSSVVFSVIVSLVADLRFFFAFLWSLRKCTPRSPTEEEISAVQQQYIAQLVAIFEKNKHRVPGYENKTLIVE